MYQLKSSLCETAQRSGHDLTTVYIAHKIYSKMANEI
jgi:hypothetical protein